MPGKAGMLPSHNNRSVPVLMPLPGQQKQVEKGKEATVALEPGMIGI